MTLNLSEAESFLEYKLTHSPAIREKLVLSYVSLVHFVLSRLGLGQDMGTDYEDMVNQGLLGLLEAVDRYDPAYGTQFSTYATLRIRGKVLDYLRSLDWLSRTARQRTRTVQTAINDLYEKNQQAPSNQAIAEYLGIEEPKVEQALTDARRVIVSLDALSDLDDENDSSLYDSLADENQVDPSDAVTEGDLKSQLLKALQNLPERERTVLALYYYEEMTLKEIGLTMGISESRVCQLHARAVLTLKAFMALTDGAPAAAPQVNTVPHLPKAHKKGPLQETDPSPPLIVAAEFKRKENYV